MISQVDMVASFASMLGKTIPAGDGPDSENNWPAMTGTSTKGRDVMVKQGLQSVAIIQGQWKYIEPSNAPPMNILCNIETGNNPLPQLYNLATDIGEKNNLAQQHPEKVSALAARLKQIREKSN
jgi:arylsulfatase A-like enzyme